MDLRNCSFKKANLTGVNFQSSKLGFEPWSYMSLLLIVMLIFQFGSVLILKLSPNGSLAVLLLFLLFALTFVKIFKLASMITKPLENAKLTGTNFSKANLSRMYLKGLNFSHANLSFAQLEKTNLRGANLAGSNLQKAVLTKADLVGTNFEGASLQEANLLLAKWDDTTNFRNADIRGTVGLENLKRS